MNDKYNLNNTGAQVQQAISSSLETFPTQINSLEANKVNKVSGKELSSNDYTNAEKNKVARLIINGTGALFLANDGTYKSTSAAIDYDDVNNKPTLNTDNTTSLEIKASETLEGEISLHKVSKTGDYNDLLSLPTLPTINLNGEVSSNPIFYAPVNKGIAGQMLVSTSGAPTWQNVPTIPSITLNGGTTLSPNFYAPTTAGTSGYYLKSNGNGAPTWASFPSIPSITLNGTLNSSPNFYAPTTAGTSGYYLKSNGTNQTPSWVQFPTIPAIGTLNTANNTSLVPSSAESFSNVISLHKISKTGNYDDLSNKPLTIDIGTQQGPVILASLSNGIHIIRGYYKNNETETSVITVDGSMFINKSDNNITILNGSKNQVNYNTLDGTLWTTKISNLVQASSFDSIEIVTDYPDTMQPNVLYMKAEDI